MDAVAEDIAPFVTEGDVFVDEGAEGVIFELEAGFDEEGEGAAAATGVTDEDGGRGGGLL